MMGKDVDEMADAMTGNGGPDGMRQVRPPAPRCPRRSPARLGWIVTLSLSTGFVAALLFAVLPFVPVTESAITGAVLCGVALGWVVLWLLSLRFTDEPQRWAAGPALLMGVGGLLLVAFGSPLREALSWVWPPTLFVLVIWMLYQTRRDMRSRSGRVQLYLVFAILAVSAVGGGCQTAGEAMDPNAMPATGRLIDVGGHELYLSCEGSGSPTVVLEPGAGATSSQTGWIAPAVARSTRVCVYDRAGRGWSEPADSPQDGAQIATDLHTLLHRGDVTGPYVLAGHSFGGLYVRIFAAHYPDEVAGLALLDSTASKEPAKSVIPSSGYGSPHPVDRVSILASLSARVGLTRAIGRLDLGTLPPRDRDMARTSVAQASWVRSTVDEYTRGSDSAQEAASLRNFADKPLLVLTAGEGKQASRTMQKEMLSLSTNSAQQILTGATHTDLVMAEEYAASTVRAILAVVDSVRNDRPLSR
jgi:pimeloyl-ACP methyl ester carboxylesterase